MTTREELRNIALGLIEPADDHARSMQAIERLYMLCAPVTGIQIGPIEDHDLYLPGGKAISPTKAALCIREIQRTTVFVRGVYHAIRDLLEKFPGKRIEVLYAGCGPYATLLLPMAGMFTSEELGIHLVDIQAQSIQAAAKLYRQTGLSAYLLSAMECDAATLTLPSNVDMVVSETMMHALMREPQVAIMQHLVPQLPPHGVFIPECITVSAQLLNDGMETERCLTGVEPPRFFLGDIYSISREQYAAHGGTNILVPEITTHQSMYLVTDICAYRTHTLGIHDSSLNLPVAVDRNVTDKAGRTIRFQYQVSENPGFVYEWL